MHVTLQGGEVRVLAAHDSETVTFTLANGTLMGVRPTVLDSQPWSRALVSLFAMPTSTKSTEEVGAVEVRAGGPSEPVKAVPGVKVAVATIAMEK